MDARSRPTYQSRSSRGLLAFKGAAPNGNDGSRSGAAAPEWEAVSQGVTEWRSSALNARHDLADFDCGVVVLNAWLTDQARRAQGSGTAMTYVWTATGVGRVVA